MQVSVKGKQVKQFCTQTAQVMQAVQGNGRPLFAKLIRVDFSEQKGFDQCLQFNTEVLEDLEDYIFKEHLLQILTQVSNEQIVGYITEPYDFNLEQYINDQPLNEKDCLAIFDQIMKTVYSVTMNGYWHRNLRAQHFVRCGKVWKLESLVFNQDYSKANGLNSEYLWSSKHEPPEFVSGKQFSDDEYNAMTVWNLGCILVHLLVGSHRFINRSVMDKFLNKPFSFQAIGIKNDRVNKFSQQTKDLLAGMLHYDSKKRTKLQELFQNKSASQAVAIHALQNKQIIPPSKISLGKSMRSSKLNFQSKSVLKEISESLAQREKEKENVLYTSKLNGNVMDDEDFFGNLQEISNRIPSKEYKTRPQQNEDPKGIEDLMSNKNHPIRKSLQLYKSYFDQSQLLVLAIDNIDKLEFLAFKDEWQVKEVRLLIKYAVVFVSLVNLNSLAEGFNQSRNMLDLDGDQFTTFQNSQEYSAFQKFVNFKRNERSKQLDALRQDITFFKKKNLATKDQKVFDLLQRDYRKTNFQQIKTAYRMILKFAYDSISEQYNQLKHSEQGKQLARRAMFVTYCLTIDKLYIKEHIPDNFKFYFQWIGKPPSNYVPLNDFKEYILNAPKEALIENSKFILKKYYNI